MEFSIIGNPQPEPAHSFPTFSLIFPESGSAYKHLLSQILPASSTGAALSLFQFIEKEYRIPQSSQLIMRAKDGKKLETSMNLADFLNIDSTLHVFTPNFEHKHDPFDDFEVIDEQPNNWIQSKTGALYELFSLSSGEVLEKGLESSIAEKLKDIFNSFPVVQREIKILKEECQKLQKQKDSERVLKQNLTCYYQEKKKNFEDVFAPIKQKLRYFQILLDNFEKNAARLSVMEIDPQLCEANQKYLIDYFEINKLRKSKRIYLKNQEKIVSKFQESEKEIELYDHQLTNVEESFPDYHEEILDFITEQEAKFEEIQVSSHDCLQQLEDRVEIIDVDNFEDSKSQAINQIQLSKTVEENSFAMKDLLNQLNNLREKVKEYLKTNGELIQDFISDIASLRLIIQEKLQNKEAILQSLLERHERDLFSLEILEKFPVIYRTTMSELQRRAKSKRDFISVLNFVQHFVEKENNQRKEFLNEYGAYLPEQLCPMLGKKFPTVNLDSIKTAMVGLEESMHFYKEPSLAISPKTQEELIQLIKDVYGFSEETDEIPILKSMEEIKEDPMDIMKVLSALEKTGLEDKVALMMKEFEEKCQQQLEGLAKKLNSLEVKKAEKMKETPKEQPFENIEKESMMIKEIENVQEETSEIADEEDFECPESQDSSFMGSGLELSQETIKSFTGDWVSTSGTAVEETDKDFVTPRAQDELLSELGNGILTIYAWLMGKEAVAEKNLDLVQVLKDILTYLAESMIKVQDLTVGNKVLGFKVPGARYQYHILEKNSSERPVTHLFETTEDYGALIQGVISDIKLTGFQESAKGSADFVKVALSNVEKIDF